MQSVKIKKSHSYGFFCLSNYVEWYYNVTMTKRIKKDNENIENAEVQMASEKPNFSDAEIVSEEAIVEVQEQSEASSEERVPEAINLQEIEEQKDIGLSKDAVDEKLKKAMEAQSPKKRKRSTIINLCLLLVNIIFMAFIVKNLVGSLNGEENMIDIFKSHGSRLWWLVGGVGVYLVFILAQVLIYLVLIKDLTGKRRIWLAYDVSLMGKYYDFITPFAVGGQPMQIARLASNGISAGTSTSIPIIKMMINNIVNMLLAVGFFIFGLPKIPTATGFNDILLVLLEIVGVIGLIITVLVVVFMVLISSGRLFTRSFVSGILRIGYKLKIVKNYRQTFKKVMNQVAEYKASMNYLWKHKLLLLKLILLCIVECLTYAIMPYFVVMAFVSPDQLAGIEPMMFLVICITKYYVCAMASSFIPLPGGTGLMEISFIFLFGLTVGNDSIVWALLVWRLLSYYLIIMHGFVHELGQIFYKLAKNRKNKLKELKN